MSKNVIYILGMECLDLLICNSKSEKEARINANFEIWNIYLFN